MPATPIFVATWKFGINACRVGWQILNSGASAVDAVEAAGNVAEDDPTVSSVGYGGLPNAAGVVELDAAIMDGPTHSAGSVAAITGIGRPISVARRIMECSPHVMLAGENARRFAVQEGFPEIDLLTETSRERYRQWLAARSAAEVAHFETAPAQTSRSAAAQAEKARTPKSHDTIGICALDTSGNLAVGCTTSGLAWKSPGRVGDSPIIGSGLYVDNEVGGAAATGHGDEMMKACVSYRAVMLMEQGRTPQEACIEAIRYLIRKRPPEQHGDYGAAIIALRKDGMVGAAATRSGFSAPNHLWQWATASSPEVVLNEGPYVTPTAVLPRLLTE